ncbi:MAG: hypothetical protein ACK4UJ_11425 [Leptonema sp. (in: bacteria)]
MKKLIFIILFLSSLLWSYETEWDDKGFGQSSFKIHGYFWFGYENIDSQKGQVDQQTKQGFTMNRSYIRIDGSVKEGDFKGWKYHVTIDGMPGNIANNGYEFLKYAFFTVPLPFNLNLIGGLQNTPTIAGGKYSLEGLWKHRFLDSEGKAMWDQLGITTSSDLGIGINQEENFYNFLFVLGNGEGFRKPYNATSLSNTTLGDLAKGVGDSYGYHLYGRFSLTPLGVKEDLPTRIFIHFPFVLRNVVGIQRVETESISTLNFTTQQFTILKGDPTAKKDYAYGIEINGIFKFNDLQIGTGIGKIIDKDKRKPAYKIDQTFVASGSIPLNQLTTYYQPAQESIGQADYIYLYLEYQKFGIVTRYYENTDDGTLSGKLKSKEGLSVIEQLFYQDTTDGIIGNLSLEQALAYMRSGTVDSGKSKQKTFLLAIEYYFNKRYKAAIGFSQSTTTNKDGTPYKITPLKANNISGYTTDNFANYVSSINGIPTNLLTDKDLIGTKRVDKQIFFRSQFTW